MPGKNIPVQYEVEDSIPIPVKRPTFNAPPLEDMKVGESFLFPRKDRSKVQVLASRLKRKERGTYTIRVVDENNCRVWRTE